MRVALVHTDDPGYLELGYADAWRAALEEQGCEVQRLGHAPAQWAVEGVPRFDLAVSHVLVRHELQGVTHAELAADLGITVAGTKSLANRARETLRRSAVARAA